ncbi:MAG: hydroxyacid dehydrogenase [Verrucomicrobia bacterium]|nr:hydroxyacid dehydrogenase [Verrucomicrobiota bacterium]
MNSERLQQNPVLLREVEVIFSGWGMPQVDVAFLRKAPALKAIFYGAGSVKGFVTEELWDRGILVTSAYAANAVPVAEFTFAEIILSLKRYWEHLRFSRTSERWRANEQVIGTFGSTVGIISLGAIGRMVCKRLQSLAVDVIAYDPFWSAERMAELGVRKAESLEQVFQQADVVSLHAPNLPETAKMIHAGHFRNMRPNATFINTARGQIVDEEGLIDVLRERTDIYALLDVTFPEPPAPGSPLYSMHNVVLTPHIAGSMNNECRRMGNYAIEECRRYIAGEPAAWPSHAPPPPCTPSLSLCLNCLKSKPPGAVSHRTYREPLSGG